MRAFGFTGAYRRMSSWISAFVPVCIAAPSTI